MNTKVTYRPDAVAHAERTVDLFADTGLAGVLPEWTETAVIGLDGTQVVTMLAPTPFVEASALGGEFPDAERAAVEYRNVLDTFRRDGWTVTEVSEKKLEETAMVVTDRPAEPWETPDPLASGYTPEWF